MAGCFVALDRFGRVSEFNRMRALRTGRTLSSPTDAAAYSEALTWLDARLVPCLSPAIIPSGRKERRTMARYAVEQEADGRQIGIGNLQDQSEWRPRHDGPSPSPQSTRPKFSCGARPCT